MRRRSLLAALSLLLAAEAAEAQLGNVLRRFDGLDLSSADRARLSEVAAALYQAPDVEVGDATDWTTERGVSVRTEITAVEGGASDRCVSVLHSFDQPGRPEPERAVSRRCLQPDGAWALFPE